MGQRTLGFSTGALEKSNFEAAVSWCRAMRLEAIELSALRFDELEPLVTALKCLDLSSFKYVSIHSPSSFARSDERRVIELLQPVHARGFNIVVHPDVIYTSSLWQHFGEQLLVENMDRRKPIGRTVNELQQVLNKLPKARLCLDVAHARQLDTTLTLLSALCTAFVGRIAEVHLSELDSRCAHRPLSGQSIEDYRQFIPKLSLNGPVIIESMLFGADDDIREQELKRAEETLAC